MPGKTIEQFRLKVTKQLCQGETLHALDQSNSKKEREVWSMEGQSIETEQNIENCFPFLYVVNFIGFLLWTEQET